MPSAQSENSENTAKSPAEYPGTPSGIHPGMSAGKHRGERAPGRSLRRHLALTGVAALATAGAVSAGVLAVGTPASSSVQAMVGNAAANAAADTSVLQRMKAERTTHTSRSMSRDRVDMTKVKILRDKSTSGGQVTRTTDLGSGDPKTIAQAMLPQFGWSSDQFSCLDSLWTKESGWNPSASNASSGAYGIPQSLPGSKMATAGSDWETNPATQIKWGLGYIRDSYGSPCSAWGHSESFGWY